MTSTERKKQETVAELAAWFGRPNCKSFYYEEPLATIEQRLQEAKLKKSIWLSFADLELWYSNEYVHDGLVKGDTSARLGSATYSYFVLELASTLAARFPDNPPTLDLHRSANYVAKVLSQKWAPQSEKMLGWILDGLGTKLLKGGQKFSVAAWFIIAVACKGFDRRLVTEKYNYPPTMGVYQAAIDNWNTEDTNELDGLVSELCDYHLAQADVDEKEMPQFSFTNEFVHAYEILAWLALREMNGLRNPESYSHPLMRLPINRLPEAVEPYQPTTLYERVLARLREEFKP